MIAPIAPLNPGLPVGLDPVAPALQSPHAPGGAFARLLLDGVGEVDRKVQAADRLAQAFALDDSIPVHQVTYALEQARMSVELMMQVRGRLLEGYQELMRMQL